jgi:hypothetical protein
LCGMYCPDFAIFGWKFTGTTASQVVAHAG